MAYNDARRVATVVCIGSDGGGTVGGIGSVPLQCVRGNLGQRDFYDTVNVCVVGTEWEMKERCCKM